MVHTETYIIENQYFPCINWFKLSTEYQYVEIEQYESFQKMSFRNRCIISGSNGLINLTVPLKNGREQKAPIKEIRIDNSQSWQKNHWRAILSSYGKSPFFEYYGEEVKRLIQNPNTFLFDLNWEIIEWLRKILKIDTEIDFTQAYQQQYNPEEYLDYRNRFLPKNYQSEENWEPTYTQVFEDKFGFIPNLSILDLLFCKGGF